MHLTAVLRSMPDPQDAISGEAANGLDRRLSARRSLRLEAHSRSNSSGDIRVLVRDVSPGGLMFETESAALSVNDYVEVCLPGSQTTKGRVVWTSGRVFGCEFNEAVSAAAISAALLKAEPQDGEILPSALANASSHNFWSPIISRPGTELCPGLRACHRPLGDDRGDVFPRPVNLVTPS